MAITTKTNAYHLGEYDKELTLTRAVISDPEHVLGCGSENTKYAKITSSEHYTTAKVYWTVDMSAIPKHATIDSVSIKAKACVNDTVGVSTASLRSSCGTTVKGNAKGCSSTTPTVYDVPTGTWTRDELDSFRILIQYNGTTQCHICFYGVDVTVTYTYESEYFMLKLNGSYKYIKKIFKKNESGIWVEQTDLANVVPDNVRYLNGGEHITSITFNINEYSMETYEITTYPYTAIGGMTWREWVESEYDDGNYYIDDDYIYSVSMGVSIDVYDSDMADFLYSVTPDMTIDSSLNYVCFG